MPILFDALQLVLEHAILVETLAVSLMVAAFMLLLPRSPGTVASFIAGCLLIGAWVVRPPLLPVIVAVGVYLAVRRVGWRPFIAFVLAAGVPYATVQVAIGMLAVYRQLCLLLCTSRRIRQVRSAHSLTPRAERAIARRPRFPAIPGWYIWTEESPDFRTG